MWPEEMKGELNSPHKNEYRTSSLIKSLPVSQNKGTVLWPKKIDSIPILCLSRPFGVSSQSFLVPLCSLLAKGLSGPREIPGKISNLHIWTTPLTMSAFNSWRKRDDNSRLWFESRVMIRDSVALNAQCAKTKIAQRIQPDESQPQFD